MKFSKKYAQLLVAAVIYGFCATAGAAQILFAHVDNDGTYVGNGNQLADMLDAVVGNDVTVRFLDQAVYNDYNAFDQIFVYDLYHLGLNNGANQVANYTGIANWYNDLTSKNLILDGRIISSTTGWVSPPETEWIQNYSAQLDSRGGGLVLGTDHATLGLDTGTFVDGINTINDLIGVERFHDAYYPPLGWNSSPGDPLDALVDVNSPLHISGLSPCSFDGSLDCINDNSSTSFVATGLQANGQTLTPVAYHGDTLNAWDVAAVSATMGSPTFGTCGEPGQPPCDVPEPSIIALMMAGLIGSGRQDSNLRPPAPQAGTLPDCATPR